MNKAKIKRLINEIHTMDFPNYSAIGFPNYLKVPKNDKLDDIWTELVLFHTDYISWEKTFLENRFDKKLVKPPIYLNDELTKMIEKFKTRTKDEKKFLGQIKKFKRKMDQIIKELLKNNGKGVS